LSSRILCDEPKYGGALHLLGIIAIYEGQQEDASPFLLRAVAAAPKDPSIHNSIAGSLMSLGRLDDSIPAYKRALARKPDHPQALQRLAAIIAVGDRHDEAAKRGRLDANPTDESGLRASIARDSEDANLHVQLANLLRRQRQIAEAETSCCVVLSLQPDHIHAQNNLGTAGGDLVTLTNPRLPGCARQS
jgi:tetratricopeptide (TPR) repeat protein